MEKPDYRVLVIGIGNLLMSDDGLGIYAVELLKKKNWPRGVMIVEVGTAVHNFYVELSRSIIVIAVDAIQAGGKPGDIYCYDGNDLARLSIAKRLDAHGFSILQHVELIRELTGFPKRFVIYGVEPSNLSFGIGLSNPIQKAVARLVDRITKEIMTLCPGN